MTCVAARVDFETGQLTLCNAGHTFPVLLSTKKDMDFYQVKSMVRKAQPMLGDMAATGHPWVDDIFDFGPEDRVVLYTDGLTDAAGDSGKSFTRKFHRVVGHTVAGSTVEQIKNQIIQELRRHTGSVAVKDDVCAIVIGQKVHSAAVPAA